MIVSRRPEARTPWFGSVVGVVVRYQLGLGRHLGKDEKDIKDARDCYDVLDVIVGGVFGYVFR